MKKIGIAANLSKPAAESVLNRLARKADAEGIELVVCDDAQQFLPQAVRVQPRTLAEHIDVLMALGGDGTILQAVRLLDGHDVPLIGVNLGSLGFLTSVPEERLEQAVVALKKGLVQTSPRSMLRCTVLRGGEAIGEYQALNDVVTGWGLNSRIVTFDINIDNEQINTARCDGLIVSTPTGSTGHSLSAGGPILQPETPVFVLNIICPHTLTNRPVVIHNRSEIDIDIRQASKQLLLVVDGQDSLMLRERDRLRIRKAEREVTLLNLPDHNYFTLLRHKLHWRGSSV